MSITFSYSSSFSHWNPASPLLFSCLCVRPLSLVRFVWVTGCLDGCGKLFISTWPTSLWLYQKPFPSYHSLSVVPQREGRASWGSSLFMMRHWSAQYHIGLMWITTATVSSWMKQLCHIRKTSFCNILSCSILPAPSSGIFPGPWRRYYRWPFWDSTWPIPYS